MPAPTLWNVPNILTLMRVALIPVLVLLAYWPVPFELQNMLVAGVFLVAAITDWFDGYLARAWNQTSAFGRFLDPVADKLMVAAALVILVQWHPHVLMVIAAVVIISREITISALREWMAEIGKRANVAVSSIGKWKTTAQMASITVLLMRVSAFDYIGYGLMFIAVALTLWSMIIYLRAAWPDLKQST
ncbi:CDP-diacylglycerol--glycerol-3-phosphate 3-phosphatidyltransferase [Fluviicoccus keumensis]|uniref:CDP-diacylglycerol--glycerol-3-phosphate 3-phosphatidyltransferase n=1 Tax=Fluviicoccus keumensis TaxID=1435465 RepID=A0A4Q7Z4M8_9GAMM|nr:CDP-diacylglycerol--glycerol-3-phosphate 3-phosphatidyltransferase [Fluviicoccus keumensis]RZU45228.1 CDP-diacylglycerol--glycerol-3-phosphate 3-phosphatidyltransferase [Fluviicoccus keumensis]